MYQTHYPGGLVSGARVGEGGTGTLRPTRAHNSSVTSHEGPVKNAMNPTRQGLRGSYMLLYLHTNAICSRFDVL